MLMKTRNIPWETIYKNHFFQYTKTMKGLALFIFIAGWAVALYFGWIHFIGKAMNTAPEIDSQKSESLQRQQRSQAEEVRERQKQLMIDRQTRMRDLQRR